MHLALTAAQQELKDELRAYFARLVEEEERTADPESSYTRLMSGGWAGTGGWASGGRSSSGARAAAPSTR